MGLGKEASVPSNPISIPVCRLRSSFLLLLLLSLCVCSAHTRADRVSLKLQTEHSTLRGLPSLSLLFNQPTRTPLSLSPSPSVVWHLHKSVARGLNLSTRRRRATRAWRMCNSPRHKPPHLQNHFLLARPGISEMGLGWGSAWQGRVRSWGPSRVWVERRGRGTVGRGLGVGHFQEYYPHEMRERLICLPKW